MKIYARILLALAIINSSLCDVTSNLGGTSENKAEASTNDHQLKLPNLKDCKDSKSNYSRWQKFLVADFVHFLVKSYFKKDSFDLLIL